MIVVSQEDLAMGLGTTIPDLRSDTDHYTKNRISGHAQAYLANNSIRSQIIHSDGLTICASVELSRPWIADEAVLQIRKLRAAPTTRANTLTALYGQ